METVWPPLHIPSPPPRSQLVQGSSSTGDIDRIERLLGRIRSGQAASSVKTEQYRAIGETLGPLGVAFLLINVEHVADGGWAPSLSPIPIAVREAGASSTGDIDRIEWSLGSDTVGGRRHPPSKPDCGTIHKMTLAPSRSLHPALIAAHEAQG